MAKCSKKGCDGILKPHVQIVPDTTPKMVAFCFNCGLLHEVDLLPFSEIERCRKQANLALGLVIPIQWPSLKRSQAIIAKMAWACLHPHESRKSPAKTIAQQLGCDKHTIMLRLRELFNLGTLHAGALYGEYLQGNPFYVLKDGGDKYKEMVFSLNDECDWQKMSEPVILTHGQAQVAQFVWQQIDPQKPTNLNNKLIAQELGLKPYFLSRRLIALIDLGVIISPLKGYYLRGNPRYRLRRNSQCKPSEQIYYFDP